MPDTNTLYYPLRDGSGYIIRYYTNDVEYYKDIVVGYAYHYWDGSPPPQTNPPPVIPPTPPAPPSTPPTGSNHPPTGSNPPYIPNTGTVPYYPPH